jgi:molybdate transport system regulatory protein
LCHINSGNSVPVALCLQRPNGLAHHQLPRQTRALLSTKKVKKMAISARNLFKGKVTALKEGPIHAEVEITTTGGDKIVATLTEASVTSLGLTIGKEAVAVVKAPWVTLLAGTPEYRFSARNQLKGTVSALLKGGVNCQVSVALPGGSSVSAMVTNAAVAELGLADGVAVTVLFKASHVFVGVPV